MRTQLTREANKLHEEQSIEIENMLHQSEQKRCEAEAALEAAKRSAIQQAEAEESVRLNHSSVLEELQVKHQRAIADLLKKHEETLQTRDKQHEYETRQKIETLRKDLQEKSNQQLEELHRQLADIDTARIQAVRNEEKTKQDAEDALKAAREKHRIDMAEQRQEFDHRANKAEAELERIRQSLKAQYESVSAPSAIGKDGSTAIHKTPDQFRKPRRKVDRRTNTVLELSPTETQALHDSQGSCKENIAPKIRTFSELDSLPIDLEIYNDTSTSSLSEVQSMSPPSQRELQLNNTPTQIRVGNNKSSSSWEPSQSMPDPFTDIERPTSKSGALANTSSRRSLNIANALSTVNSPLLDRDDFMIGSPGNSVDVQQQPISHSNVSQIQPEDATDGLVPNTSRFFQPKLMVQSVEKNVSSSPEFMAESQNLQNLTTYGHPTASRSHSDSSRDESRKRKSSSAHHEDQVSKKSRASLVVDDSHVIAEMQYSLAQADPQTEVSTSFQSQNQRQSVQLISGTRHKMGHSISQITNPKSSKAQDDPTSMISQISPSRGNSRGINSNLPQLQSQSSSAQALTSMSRARSSQTNRRKSNRRTKSAKAAKKSMYFSCPVGEAKADILL